MADKKEILKRVGDSIKVESVTKEYILNSFDLVTSSTDKEIEKVLGENHLFDKGEVYALVGNLIAKQPSGEEGTLLNNGYSNLFYTSAFVVDVYWSGSYWGVSTWRRGDSPWVRGSRVFSPAN